MMEVTVRYFAACRERVRLDSEKLELPGALAIPAFKEWLLARRPELKPVLPWCRVAVNQDFAGDDVVLMDGDEIAFIPPVAGGGGMVSLHAEPIDPAAIEARVRRDSFGGYVSFTGRVRNHSEGRGVVRLEYEAYPEMALKVFEQLRSEAAAKWPGVEAAIAHRHGLLEIGDIAVVIVTGAPHRQEAFAACQWIIDELKQRAPIWKKQTTPEGDSWVGLGP
ncbi:MAG: hypothetical protein GMKNLPBB_01821 [Myxococcota bacterium]|nr:hypothetical protein [Myxococcota bacterium]